MKNTFISAGVAVLVVVLGFVFFAPKPNVVTEVLGSCSGQNVDSRQFLLGGLTQGGFVAATTSTAATYTLVAKDFAGAPTVISWLPNVNTTVSIGATSTREFIPEVGNVAYFYLRNASTTAAATITLAAVDAGLDLQMAEATGGDLVLSGLDWAKVTLIRTGTHLVTVIFDEMTEAD